MQRYRITRTPPEGVEQTWVLLPDLPSADMQARELAQRGQGLRVRVYHEVTGQPPALVLDLGPGAGPSAG